MFCNLKEPKTRTKILVNTLGEVVSLKGKLCTGSTYSECRMEIHFIIQVDWNMKVGICQVC